MLAAVGGFLLLLNTIRSLRIWRLFCSGALLGLAFLMKQPGIFFAVFAGLYLMRSLWKAKVGWREVGDNPWGAAKSFQ
jgi:4-amino-4-deoxy-L-arabinose transferase-like glycosyltransferase